MRRAQNEKGFAHYAAKIVIFFVGKRKVFMDFKQKSNTICVLNTILEGGREWGKGGRGSELRGLMSRSCSFAEAEGQIAEAGNSLHLVPNCMCGTVFPPGPESHFSCPFIPTLPSAKLKYPACLRMTFRRRKSLSSIDMSWHICSQAHWPHSVAIVIIPDASGKMVAL